MKASLSEFSMAELMGLARRAKDKVVALKMEDPFVRIIFEAGEPVFAVYRDLKGREAFLASMFVEDGEVEITPIVTQAKIRSNLDASFDQLLSEFASEQEVYAEARSLIDNLDNTVGATLAIEKDETIRVGQKEWSVLISLLKGLTLKEAAVDSGTAEYMVVETVSNFLRLGLLSVNTSKQSEEEQAFMEEIANQPLQTDFSPVAMVEADVDAMSCDVLENNVEFTDTQTFQAESNLKEGIVEDQHHSAQLVEDFELKVTMLPIISDFLDNPEIDDETIVINEALFQDLVARCGRSFGRCMVSNLKDEHTDPLIMKIYVHSAVEETAISTAALFRLKVWSGSAVRVKPLFEEIG